MVKGKTLVYWVISLLAALLLCEVLARLAFSLPLLSQRLWANESLSWQRQWVEVHSRRESRMYYSFDVYSQTKGWFTKPNLRDIPVFDNKTLNTNARGLRGVVDFSYERAAGKTRILVIGDSFTFGDDVSDNETYVHQLQRMLPRAEVINMGVHGYGHDQMLILLEEEGVRYRPDIVVLGFLPIDAERNMLSFRDFAKPRYVEVNGEWRLVNSPVPSPDEVQRWDWTRPRLFDLYANLRFRLERHNGAYFRDKEKVTNVLLERILLSSRAMGARPVFVYLPSGNELSATADETLGEQYLKAFCRSQPGLACMSTRPDFVSAIEAGQRFNQMGHWWPLGHMVAADSIYRFLLAQGLVGGVDVAAYSAP